MSNVVLWLDSEKATIFNLTAAEIEKSQLEKTNHNHHTINKKDNKGDSDGEHFYRDLAIQLKEAGQLLIMGPGLAKNHFKTHLETHHTGDLAKRIVGMETVDHPTDNQIVAVARKFFKA